MDSDNEILVVELPPCDVLFCNNKAEYNAKTKAGPWSLCCQKHFEEFGIGLGMGKGLKLVVKQYN